MDPKPRTTNERLAVIEEILLRTEAKLDRHIERTDRRVGRVERVLAYASGFVTLAITGLVTYIKVHFR